MPRSAVTARAALLGTLLAACAGDAPSTAPRPDGAVARAAESGFTATLAVTPERVPPGGEFTVRYTLRNGTGRTANATLPCSALVFMSVHTAAGERLDGGANLPSVCSTMITHTTLPAGRDTVIEAQGRAVDLVYPPLGERLLEPGTYTVVATPSQMTVDGRGVRLPALSRPLVVE